MVLGVGNPGATGSPGYLASSGDAATGTAYTAPTLTPMSISATAMSTGATTTSTTAPATEEATSFASPTLSQTPEATCTEKGVALPGGCH